MNTKIEKFLKILKIELTDLENDITLLEELAQSRRDNHEITPYVLSENMALLKREFNCVAALFKTMDLISLEGVEEIPEAGEKLKALFRERGCASDFPKAVYVLVDRKIDKVVRYINET